MGFDIYTISEDVLRTESGDVLQFKYYDRMEAIGTDAYRRQMTRCEGSARSLPEGSMFVVNPMSDIELLDGTMVYLADVDDPVWFEYAPVPGTPCGVMRRFENGWRVIDIEEDVAGRMERLKEIWTNTLGISGRMPQDLETASDMILNAFWDRFGGDKEPFNAPWVELNGKYLSPEFCDYEAYQFVFDCAVFDSIVKDSKEDA